jgi:hypothetical protein
MALRVKNRYTLRLAAAPAMIAKQCFETRTLRYGLMYPEQAQELLGIETASPWPGHPHRRTVGRCGRSVLRIMGILLVVHSLVTYAAGRCDTACQTPFLTSLTQLARVVSQHAIHAMLTRSLKLHITDASVHSTELKQLIVRSRAPRYVRPARGR